MDNLGIMELYEKNSGSNNVKEFMEKTDSTLRVQTDMKKSSRDTEWLDIIELTIPYIENIFTSPNRFIVNEEEIVKIEQARKVSVETIKHLSKHTNLIQTIDDETGDVTPSKLLNVRKEESYDTYENRLIYTLVQNTKMFINKKKDELFASINIESDDQGDKDNKRLEYNATSEIKDEKVDIKMDLSSKLESDCEESKEKNESILHRIEEIERRIQSFINYGPYAVIDKLHITLVREPIRKTNVVLKNVNFQYAMKLWSYLRENFDENFAGEEQESEDYMDNGELKQFIDETFLLQYLSMKTLDEDKAENEATYQELKQQIVEQMIEKMVDMDDGINYDDTENPDGVDSGEQQLIQMISKQYEVIKYKKTEVIKEIQQIFKKHIEKYEEQVEKR